MNFKSLRFILFVASLCFGDSVSVPTLAQESGPAKNAGSISGRVSVDGKPRSGLLIELLTTITTGPRRLVAKTTTDKLGRYALTNVNSGTYDVSPSSPTLVIPNQGRSGQSGKTVSLEAGERIKGIDFELMSQGIISGRVRDIRGEPVRGQTVELIARSRDNGYSRPFHPSEPGEQSTNDDGVYRISGVPPGRYIVKVGVAYGLAAYRSSEAGQLYYPEVFHPNADEASKATVVEVVRGQETTDVDITVGNPLKVYEIVGHLISEKTGDPVPNVALEVTTTGKTSKTSVHGAWSSDATGTFRIQNALPGHYFVVPENDRVGNTYGDPISFDVTDADVIGLKIPMHSAATLTGVVTVQSYVDVNVADLFSNLIIIAHSSSSDDLTSSTMSSTISADGQFQIAGIRPGRVNLDSHVLRGGPEGFSLIRVERNGVEARDGIEVHSGEDLKGVRLTLGTGNSVLRGDVKIEGGQLEGVNLYVIYRLTSGDPHRFHRAELDARRHFVIKGLMPGEYELMIGPMSVDVSGERGSQTMNRLPTVKQNVVVGPGADAEVVLVMTLRPAPPQQ